MVTGRSSWLIFANRDVIETRNSRIPSYPRTVRRPVPWAWLLWLCALRPR
jgi:hypothetical protein